MSIAIVLPTLTEWTEQHISAIYSATTESDFESAFDAFLAQEVSITSNGQRLSREQYKQKLLTEKKGEISGGVSFTGAVQANGAEGQLLVVRIVCLCYFGWFPYRNAYICMYICAKDVYEQSTDRL